jgi:ATP-dependent helicase/nuclease subunit A
MADPRPTLAQWKAIVELDKHLSVSAGAGAGKTWVLTERYTTMLAGRPLGLPPEEIEEAASASAEGAADGVVAQSPARPANIVAITFTKEAAGEMKARIRERLNRWKGEASADMQREIGLLKEEVERATITTIHGYCSELLREFPLEAGIDPQFYVLEESEARFWLDESVREVLDGGLNDGDEQVIRLVDEFGYEALVGELMRFYPGLREQTERFAEVAAQTEARLAALTHEMPGQVVELERLLAAIVSVDLSKKDTSKGSAGRAARLAAEMPAVREVLERWRESGWRWQAELPELLDGLVSGWGTLIKELKEDVNGMKACVARLRGMLVPDGMIAAVQDVCALLEKVHATYSDRKAGELAVDFTDLQNRAVRLLEHPAVRRWQRERLRFLMVDEFQDTNPVQKRLLDALGEGNDRLRLFVVGDAKQSIYRFRGADLEVFLQTQAEVQARDGEHLSLAHNFRTQGPVIQFVNRLFARLMADSVGYEPMVHTRVAAHEESMVEILHLMPQGDSMESRLQEAQAIAHRIKEMVGQEQLVPTADGLRAVEYRDITLLFSAMTNVGLYEHALQQEGIPYYIVGSRHFFRRQEVIDLVLLLQAVVDARDPLALIGTLRSPLFGVSDEALYWLGAAGVFSGQMRGDWQERDGWEKLAGDDRERLARAQRFLRAWRQEKSFRTAGELLAAVLEETGYEQALLLSFGGRQKVGNVRKFVELAFEQPPERAGVLPFLQRITRLIEEGIDEEDAQVESDRSDVVRIMTVHKSKGLEFPVVILPDMGREANLRRDGKFQYAPDYGLAVSFAENEAWNDYGFGPQMREAERQKALEEERRKLYVAMTRARDYLLLVGTREEPKSGMTLESSRWFDWLVAAMADGSLAGMEAAVQAAWPEVKWVSAANASEGDGAGEAEEAACDVGQGQLVAEEQRVGNGAGETAWAESDARDGHLSAERRPLEAVREAAAAIAELAAGKRDHLASAGRSTGTFVGEVETAEGSVASPTHMQIDSSSPLATAFPLLGALQLREEESPGLRLSVSALLTYLSCPRQYFYRYEWKLPEQPLEPSSAEGEAESAQEELFAYESAREAHVMLEEGEAPALQTRLQSQGAALGTGTVLDSGMSTDVTANPTLRGTLVHRVLELTVDPSEGEASIQRTLAERGIVGAAAEAWTPVLRRELDTYLASDLFQQVQSAAEQRSELLFRLTLGRHEVTGILDKVFRNADGQAVVIDYKTNRIRPNALDRTSRHYAPQLQLYTRVVQRLLGWPVERAVLYFTALDQEAAVPVAETDLQALESQLIKAMNSMAMAGGPDDFAASAEESACLRCGYRKLCKGL